MPKYQLILFFRSNLIYYLMTHTITGTIKLSWLTLRKIPASILAVINTIFLFINLFVMSPIIILAQVTFWDCQANCTFFFSSKMAINHLSQD